MTSRPRCGANSTILWTAYRRELKCSGRLSGTPLKALIPAQIDGSLDDATFATLIEEGRRGKWLEYAMPIRAEKSARRQFWRLATKH